MIEKSLEKLAELAKTVSSVDATLDDSMKAFEEGVKIAEECIKQLQEYKGKLIVLDEQLKKLKDEN